MKKHLNVTVLKGGISAEREVSLRSGAAVARALTSLGHMVTEVDVTRPDFPIPAGTDFVFILLHGTFGEDGGVQARLEAMGLPFNGCGSEASRRAFDKDEAKRLFAACGVPTPRGAVWKPGLTWPLPYILKPVAQGSSIGVFRVTRPEDVAGADAGARELGCEMLIEEMILGPEFTVGVLGDRALPVIEIRPREGFYDYHNKYTAGCTEYLCPAPLSEGETEGLQKAALAAHRALGCEVYSRVDVMRDEKGDAKVLEVNTIPGMTELSLLPKAAAVAGLDFPALCEEIMERSLAVRGGRV
jgi:D-alanine-D-alanine ligase